MQKWIKLLAPRLTGKSVHVSEGDFHLGWLLSLLYILSTLGEVAKDRLAPFKSSTRLFLSFLFSGFDLTPF